MIGRKLTSALVALGMVTLPATPSMACSWFSRCAKPTTTFYAPVVAAPVVQPTVVNYMPQTAYRTVVVNRPVVSYVPQPACDACGRSTTVMRPVTTMVPQQQLVPYTTYRAVASVPAAPCCGATPVSVGYAPATVMAPAAPACCGGAAPAVTSFSAPVSSPAPAAPCCGTQTPTPSLSGYAPSAGSTPNGSFSVTPSPAPSGSPGTTLQSLQPTPDPTLNSPPATTPDAYQPSPSPPDTTPNSTFAPSSTGAAEPQSRILLPPPPSTSSSTGTRYRGLDPEDNSEDGGDRTTAIPVRGSYTVRQASLVVPITRAAKPAVDDGWRPAAE